MYFVMSVRSHFHVAVSRTCHQLAGDTNTLNCESVGVQFTAITRQATRILRFVGTFEFYYKILNVKIQRCYAVTTLDLSVVSGVNEGNTNA